MSLLLIPLLALAAVGNLVGASNIPPATLGPAPPPVCEVDGKFKSLNEEWETKEQKCTCTQPVWFDNSIVDVVCVDKGCRDNDGKLVEVKSVSTHGNRKCECVPGHDPYIADAAVATLFHWKCD